MTSWDDPEVTRQKVVGYLLAVDHLAGKAKAAFFGALGYDEANWEVLRDDLIAVAAAGQPGTESESEWGTKYTIDGILTSPTGRVANVRTVWIVGRGESRPRLVTAYPR